METPNKKILSKNKITPMKKIKKFKDIEKEVTGFDASSLEQETEEIMSLGSTPLEAEHDEKELEKVKKSKIEKFESFVDIHIDNIENMTVTSEWEFEGDDKDDDEDDNEFDAEYEEDEKCNCCDNCTGEEGCYCGCEDCKCGEVEVIPASQMISGELSENLKWHIENSKPITENIFRPGSEAFFEVIKEARKNFDLGKINLTEIDKEIFESTEIGNFAKFKGQIVPLDLPMENVEGLNEAEYKGKEVKLNYPMRGGTKKYYVYVKNPKSGNVKKIAFGDVHGGLTAKVSNPEARKSFAARHKCSTKKDKTKAGYWACRINKYGHLWGGKTYPGYW